MITSGSAAVETLGKRTYATMTGRYPNQRGSLMIAALLMLLGLSLTVFMAARIALTNSKMMRNNRLYRDNLYRAETLLSVAAEEHRRVWLDEDSVLFDLQDGKAEIIHSGIVINAGGTPAPIGEYRVARIEKNPDPDSLSGRFYQMYHLSPPAVGSATSGQMTARRYGVLATGTDGRGYGQVVLEAGFSRIF